MSNFPVSPLSRRRKEVWQNLFVPSYKRLCALETLYYLNEQCSATLRKYRSYPFVANTAAQFFFAPQKFRSDQNITNHLSNISIEVILELLHCCALRLALWSTARANIVTPQSKMGEPRNQNGECSNPGCFNYEFSPPGWESLATALRVSMEGIWTLVLLCAVGTTGQPTTPAGLRQDEVLDLEINTNCNQIQWF